EQFVPTSVVVHESRVKGYKVLSRRLLCLWIKGRFWVRIWWIFWFEPRFLRITHRLVSGTFTICTIDP
ncbi:MAG: hypothetical protein PHD26_02865, partial [Methanosarcinaceae archaeon]|nr:hypothetical protein [Methanosarcinaceae archaeon]